MKRVNLVNAATEFNKVVKLQEPIDIKGNDDLAKDLFSALIHVESGDKFSEKTEKVFKQLKKQFEQAEVGTATKDTDKNKQSQKQTKMSKKDKAEKGTKGATNVELIATILNPSVKKEDLVVLIENEKVFKKVKEDLLKVTNFMSLKKQMLEQFDEEQVKEIRASMPKPERKPKAPKAPKVDPVIAEIEGAEDVDDLKVIAKADDRFNWKELKGLKKVKKIRKAMLAVVAESKPKAKKAEAPKMVPNPDVAEVQAFKKLKKLKAWAKENLKADWKELKGSAGDVDELKAAILELIPAEIEKKGRKSPSSTGRPGVVATIIECLEGADKKGISKQSIHDVLVDKFPDRDAEGMMKTINTQVPGRLTRDKGLDVKRLENGNYRIKS